MKKVIVVVGTLFVLLVLAYLFQQNNLKEGVGIYGGHEADRLAAQQQVTSGTEGPGSLTRGQVQGFGKGGENYPVNMDDPEILRKLGMDTGSLNAIQASRDEWNKLTNTQRMELEREALGTGRAAGPLTETEAKELANGGPPYTVVEGDPPNRWTTSPISETGPHGGEVYRILNNEGEPTNTVYDPSTGTTFTLTPPPPPDSETASGLGDMMSS